MEQTLCDRMFYVFMVSNVYAIQSLDHCGLKEQFYIFQIPLYALLMYRVETLSPSGESC